MLSEWSLVGAPVVNAPKLVVPPYDDADSGETEDLCLTSAGCSTTWLMSYLTHRHCDGE
jgi:hypothetical protein